MTARLGLLWLERRYIATLDEGDRWDAWLRLRGFDAHADELKAEAEAKASAGRREWAEKAGALNG